MLVYFMLLGANHLLILIVFLFVSRTFHSLPVRYEDF